MFCEIDAISPSRRLMMRLLRPITGTYVPLHVYIIITYTLKIRGATQLVEWEGKSAAFFTFDTPARYRGM
jgi:hypothetical protein